MDTATADVIATAAAPVVMVSAGGLLFEKRVRATQRALESLYVAIFCFVATAMLLAAAPWLGRAPMAVAGAVFTLGIAFVLLAIVLEFLEMRVGLQTMALELRSLK